MTERLQMRIYNPDASPTLIYLPGLHGDWTLVSNFRNALGKRLHFVEVTYPRTLVWTLNDYASGVECALADHGITRGWLLGESFSSQVVWPIATRGRFQVDGIILAGGFGRHPVRGAVKLAERFAGGVSLTLLTRILFGYAKIARFRHRNSPATLSSIDEFIARRTELDRQAAKHRLHLIASNDPCDLAGQVVVPVFALSGFWDPVVPWFFVRKWLRNHCTALQDYRIIRHADHNVLGTAPRASADQIVDWIRKTPASKEKK